MEKPQSDDMMLTRKYQKIRQALVVVLLMALAFMLGRHFGFNEACRMYDPVIEQAQSVIEEMQEEIEEFRKIFAGKSDDTGCNA